MTHAPSHALTLWPRLFAAFCEPSQTASKCVAELAMALHYLRRDYPSGALPEADLAQAESAIAERIASDDWLRLAGNGFLIQQCVTPYLFLRGQIPASRFHDGLIDDLAQTDRSVRECTPYRRLERSWLLFKLGQGPLPSWDNAPIMADVEAAQAFNRDLSYAFTHTVFFCTDFAGIRRPDPMIKTVALMIAAQSHAASDVDLFFECCICLMSQDLTAAELNGLLHLVADLSTRHAVLFEAHRLEEEYHPLFVYDILRGLMLRWHQIDIAVLTSIGPDGPYEALLTLATALCGKDAGAIMRALAKARTAGCPHDVLHRMVEARLSCLASLARHGALFEREFAVLNRRDDTVYPAYVAEVSALLAGLSATSETQMARPLRPTGHAQ
jgi:hypothetical protein